MASCSCTWILHAPVLALQSPTCGARTRPPLLAYAEAAEDLAEQVVCSELAGDLGQRIMGQPQFFSQQFQRRGTLVTQRQRALQVLARLLQRLDMPGARNEQAFGQRLPAGSLQQRLAQRLQALRRCAPTG